MILVDTSVIIDYLRNADPKLDGLFQTLPVGICGVTRAEILHGVRSPADRARTLVILNAFVPVATDEPVWDAAGDNLHSLRTNGVTLPFPDAVIATVAIAHNIELWTRDGHFGLVQSVLHALRLFVEPP
jgi:predicted nucleic acid-binding protein